MEKTLRSLERFAGKIEKMSDVNWNPVYAGLCYTIDDYGRAVIPLLLKDVQDKSKDWKYRYMLVDRLIFVKGKTPDDQWEICRVLLKVSFDEDEGIDLRRNSIDALSLLAGTSSLMDNKRREEVAKELIKLTRDNTEPTQIRWEVVRDMPRFAKHYGDILFQPMLDLSGDANKDIRAMSISALHAIAHFTQDKSIKTRIKTVIVDRLQVEEDNLVKEEIISAIKLLKVREAIPYLLESLKDGKYCSKAQAAELLGIMKVKEAVPLLIEGMYNKSNQYFGAICVKALGNIGDERAIEPLIDILRNDPSIGEVAASSLARMKVKKAIPVLREVLQNKGTDQSTKQAVVMALMVLNDKESIPLMHETIREGEKKDPRSWGDLERILGRFKRGEKINIEGGER